MLDRELEQTDTLLSDVGRPRLRARRVAAVEEASRFAKLIPTADWAPVDVQIRVSAVASLVTTLGGEQLYGDDPEVPLRELIQNAVDAVRARRLLEKHPSGWGEVTVRSYTIAGDQWLEVSDNGVGMSERVLTGPFVDFGNSLWGSHLMHTEFPGLESSGFRSTGRFGIGFFSVFMLGDRIQVITRRYEYARNGTCVLEFENGVSTRPLLRKALPDEMLAEGGTTIRILLRKKTQLTEEDLPTICASLCPTLDVNLTVHRPDGTSIIAVRADDWMTLTGADLLCRLASRSLKPEQKESFAAKNGERLKFVRDSEGQAIGRICIHPPHEPGVFGSVTCGGFAVGSFSRFAGVLLGEVSGVSRKHGRPNARLTEVAEILSKDAEELLRSQDPTLDERELAYLLAAFNLTPGPLRFARYGEEWVNFDSIQAISSGLDEILIVGLFHQFNMTERYGGRIRLDEGVFVTNVQVPIVTSEDGRREWPGNRGGRIGAADGFPLNSLAAVVLRAVGKAWGTSLEQMKSCVEKENKVEIGFFHDKPPLVSGSAYRVRRPAQQELPKES
jgi:hypothetical protein